MKFFYIAFIFLLFANVANSQSLIINEVSNGGTGSEEYVELLVVGTPSCGVNATLDMRNYYIDDNNGSHAAGAGTGIATGCVRFKNVAFWQNIPIGTLILIYNNLDKNSSITLADDASMTDGNGRLIIPVSHTLLETNTLTPIAGGTSTYPTTGFTSGGNWTTIGLANGDDSFHTVDNSGNIVFAVSYNNNNLNNDIYFAASQGGKVIYNANTVNNVYSNQANWANTVVAGNETPGVPNNAANAQWIASMTVTPASPSVTVNSETICSGNTVTLTATPSVAGGTYSWSPGGQSTSTISVSPTITTTYSVAYSVSGCSATATSTVTVSNTPTLIISSTSPSVCASSQTETLSLSGSAGTYSWSTGATTPTISISTPGVYTATVTTAGCGIATASISIALRPDPTVTIPISNYTACPGGTVTIVATSSENNYSWTGSSNTTATLTLVVTTSTTGAVTTTNVCGSDISAYSINIVPGATITVDVNPVNICAGQNATITATSSETTYTWQPGNVHTNTIVVNSANVYTVSSAGACNTAIKTVTVTTGGAPTLTITPSSNTLCTSGQTATLSLSGSTGTYSWNTGAITPTISISSPGVYTATVTTAGCGSANATRTITSVLVPTISVSPTSTLLCNAQTAVLTATSNITNYSWSTGTVNSNTILVSTANTYTVGVSNACGSATTSVIVTTGNKPVLNLSASSLTICPNETATLTVTGGAAPYSWSGSSSTGSVITTSGGLTTVTNTNQCGSTTASITVNVSPVNADITGTPLIGVKPLIVAFTNNSTGATTYTWSFGNGNTSNTQNPSSQTYSSGGSYTVHLSISNGICTDTDSLVVIVLEQDPELIIPNVFTPNNDSVNDVFKVTGFNITEFDCTIFDRWGIKMFAWNDITKGWDGKANGKQVPDGTYFYIINAKDITDKEIKKQGTVNLFR